LVILGNPIAGIVGALVGYFWFAPWTANLAKEHNRSINWAYFYGFLFSLIGCGIYWLYVTLTKDPSVSPNSVHHRDTTIGEWIVLILSLIFALFATFSQPINGGIASIFGAFIGSFAILLIILYIVYWLITKLFPKSKYWSIVLWIIAIVGIPVVLIIVAVFIFGVIFGLAGTISSLSPSSSGTLATFENPALGYKVQYPDTWTFKTINEQNANYITDTTFSSNDGKRGLLIQVVDQSGTVYQMNSLDEWTKNGIALLSSSKEYSQLTIQKNERTTLAGYPAQRLEYTYVTTSGIKVKNIEYLLIKGSKGYNIDIFSTDDDFNSWSNIAQEIIDSFKIAT
jgi:uncharacterized membrane protein YeaQ/YmgE (transglycosylase-associated protein family)